MKQETTIKTITCLKYSLSREEQEILTKSSYILEQVFDIIAEYSNINVDDLYELVGYFHNVFGEDVDADNFTICGIIDTIINHNNVSFIAAQEDYTDD